MKMFAALLILVPTVAQGQWWGGADAGFGGHSFGLTGSSRGLALRGAGGWERGRLLLEGYGTLLDERGTVFGRARLRFPWRRWTLSVDGRATGEEDDGWRRGLVSSDVTLSYRHAGWGVWAGYRMSWASASEAPPAPGIPIPRIPSGPLDTTTTPQAAVGSLTLPSYDAGVTAGAWHQAGPFLLTLTLASDLVPVAEVVPVGPVDTLGGPGPGDSLTLGYRRAAEAQMSGAWAKGPVSLRAVLGRRLAYGGQMWGSLEGAVGVFHDVAAVARMGKRPADLRTGLPAETFLFAGIRLSTRPFRRAPALAPVRPAILRFAVDSVGAHGVRIWVVAPHASSVELMSDLTDWYAVSLSQVDADRWATDLAHEPGPHRVVVRVDGGAWTVPPGLPALDDEFHGQVGLLLLP